MSNSDDFDIRVVRVMVGLKNARVFDDMALFIEIDDEAAGEFIKLSKNTDNLAGTSSISITKEEWPIVKKAIDEMMEKCRDD